MATDSLQSKFPNDLKDKTYGSVMKEIGSSARELIQSEINLLLVEFKSVGHNVAIHTKQAFFSGILLTLSVIPFLAFLVIGLGELLEGQYWLSSLIVSVVCALIGAPFYFRALKKLKDEDFKMPHTKASLDKEITTLQRKIQDLKTTVKGDPNESH